MAEIYEGRLFSMKNLCQSQVCWKLFPQPKEKCVSPYRMLSRLSLRWMVSSTTWPNWRLQCELLSPSWYGRTGTSISPFTEKTSGVENKQIVHFSNFVDTDFVICWWVCLNQSSGVWSCHSSSSFVCGSLEGWLPPTTTSIIANRRFACRFD